MKRITYVRERRIKIYAIQLSVGNKCCLQTEMCCTDPDWSKALSSNLGEIVLK